VSLKAGVKTTTVYDVMALFPEGGPFAGVAPWDLPDVEAELLSERATYYGSYRDAVSPRDRLARDASRGHLRRVEFGDKHRWVAVNQDGMAETARGLPKSVPLYIRIMLTALARMDATCWALFAPGELRGLCEPIDGAVPTTSSVSKAIAQGVSLGLLSTSSDASKVGMPSWVWQKPC
jgi:hypothetical protein